MMHLFNKMSPFCIRRSICAFMVLMFSMLWQVTAMADIAVIANPASAIGSIDAATVKRIYLGKLKSWPDGSSLTVVDSSAGTAMRQQFLKQVVGKKEIKFDSYWSRKAFSGKGTPPKNLGSDADIKAYIAANVGSIGYINAAQVDATVKVLMKIK